MQIHRIEQNSEEWLLHRLGKITGTKVKGVRPKATNKAKRYEGFWTVLAEKAAIPGDGEPPIERGHRLENVALEMLSEKLGIPFDYNPGIWVSDIDDDIMVSPDGAEPVDDGELPTYSAEVKCLSSGQHLKYIYEDMKARKRSDYEAIYSIPNETPHFYRDQVVQAFVVNEKLEHLFFTLFDDRQELDHLMIWAIHIKRQDIQPMIDENLEMELGTLVEINQTLAELAALKEEEIWQTHYNNLSTSK